MLSVVLNELTINQVGVLQCCIVDALVPVVLIVLLHIEQFIERFKQILAIL